MDYVGNGVGKGDGYKDVEGRAASVVFKFRIYLFLCTVNITLSPTDLWLSIYEIRSSLLVTTCPSTAVIMSPHVL